MTTLKSHEENNKQGSDKHCEAIHALCVIFLMKVRWLKNNDTTLKPLLVAKGPLSGSLSQGRQQRQRQR